MEAFISAVFGLVFSVAAVIVRGHVLSILWGWFLVPLGLRPIGAVLAIGVSLTISLFIRSLGEAQDPEWAKNPQWGRALDAIVSAYLALGVGWIILQFLPAP